MKEKCINIYLLLVELLIFMKRLNHNAELSLNSIFRKIQVHAIRFNRIQYINFDLNLASLTSVHLYIFLDNFFFVHVVLPRTQLKKMLSIFCDMYIEYVICTHF